MALASLEDLGFEMTDRSYVIIYGPGNTGGNAYEFRRHASGEVEARIVYVRDWYGMENPNKVNDKQPQEQGDTWDPDLDKLLATVPSEEIDKRAAAGLCLNCGLRPCQDDFWACRDCDPSGQATDKQILIEGLLNEKLIDEDEAKELAELSYDEVLGSIKQSWDEELRRKRL